MRISDWSSDVCSSDLAPVLPEQPAGDQHRAPDDAVHDDLQRRHRLEQVPVQRHHAPDHERADGHPQAATIERRRRHVDTSAAGATFGARALDSVIATTPSRITAIARAPQNVTRTIDRMTGAPPAFAPSAPSSTRHRSETATTSGINCCPGAAATTASGMIAPALNVAADVNAACNGRAVDMSEIPSS